MDAERLNKLGEEAPGASHHQCSDIRGTYTEDGTIFSEMQRRRKGTMVKSCSEGNHDQRHVKEIGTPVESEESLSLEIC